ncbi:hypothetical protein H0E87_024584, partial [Populus deltoides]
MAFRVRFYALTGGLAPLVPSIDVSQPETTPSIGREKITWLRFLLQVLLGRIIIALPLVSRAMLIARAPSTWGCFQGTLLVRW